tara:strand:+ start:1208 stop:1732 length:525 start_codon:yes stop_codon:yes gene_type:complete
MNDCGAYLGFLNRVQKHEIDVILQVYVGSAKHPIEIRNGFDSRVVCFHSDSWRDSSENHFDIVLRPYENIRFVAADIADDVRVENWWLENEGVDIDMVLIGIDGGEKNISTLMGMGNLLDKVEYILTTIKVSENMYQKFNELLLKYNFEGTDIESFNSRYNIALFRKSKRIKKH